MIQAVELKAEPEEYISILGVVEDWLAQMRDELSKHSPFHGSGQGTTVKVASVLYSLNKAASHLKQVREALQVSIGKPSAHERMREGERQEDAFRQTAEGQYAFLNALLFEDKTRPLAHDLSEAAAGFEYVDGLIEDMQRLSVQATAFAPEDVDTVVRMVGDDEGDALDSCTIEKRKIDSLCSERDTVLVRGTARHGIFIVERVVERTRGAGDPMFEPATEAWIATGLDARSVADWFVAMLRQRDNIQDEKGVTP